MFVELRTESGPVMVNPEDVTAVYEVDSYRHRGPAIGIRMRDTTRFLVYGDSPQSVSEKLFEKPISREALRAYVAELRRDADYTGNSVYSRIADEIERRFLR